jgi:hypothetical protein
MPRRTSRCSRGPRRRGVRPTPEPAVIRAAHAGTVQRFVPAPGSVRVRTRDAPRPRAARPHRARELPRRTAPASCRRRTAQRSRRTRAAPHASCRIVPRGPAAQPTGVARIRPRGHTPPAARGQRFARRPTQESEVRGERAGGGRRGGARAGGWARATAGEVGVGARVDRRAGGGGKLKERLVRARSR